MIYALAVQIVDFKNCCLQKGKFDDSLRDYFLENNIYGAHSSLDAFSY